MSQIVTLIVTCDDPWHVAPEQVPVAAGGADVQAARAVLKQDGWTFLPGGRVYCPGCTKARKTIRQRAS